MNNKQKYIIIFLSLFSLLSFQNCSQNKEDIIAEVGSYQITVNEFSNRYLDYLVMSGLEDNITNKKEIVRNLVNERLLFYYDDNEVIFNNPNFKKELE